MPRTGHLDVIKECSEYKGGAGEFCTITSSNLGEIAVGSKVIYADGVGEDSLDTDILLDAGSGNSASGHVKLDLATDKGVVTFSSGTGLFSGFQANADVSPDPDGQSHWVGTYSFD